MTNLIFGFVWLAIALVVFFFDYDRDIFWHLLILANIYLAAAMRSVGES